MNRNKNLMYYFFKLKNRIIGNNRISKYYDLVKNETLTKDEIADLNFKKRQQILSYAYKHTSFYRDLYDKNEFHPSMLKSERDWAFVPVVTKEMIKENFDKFIISGTNKKDTSLSSTGGSTGTPLKVLHDKRFPHEILGWRMLKWWGVYPSDHIAIIYRQRFKTNFQIFLNNLIWFPTKRLFLDASSMSPSDIEVFIKRFNKIRPTIVQGYVGAIEKVALYILDNNIKCHSPKICWVTSSPITEIQRHTISRAFKCEILDQYGCGEVFWLASECPSHGGLHVFNDCRHIDILDNLNKPVNQNILGNVAITDLENKVFPIIKYLNGDRSKYHDFECKCGMPFPLLDSVKGRVTDCIYLRNTGIIGGDYLTTIFDDYSDSIKGFQVEQFEDYSLVVKYIPNNLINDDKLNIVLNDVKSVLLKKTMNSIPISFKLVKTINDNRGKIQFVISHVSRALNN